MSYSVTISIFRSSCSFVRLESPAEISRREETLRIYRYIYMHMQLARYITSFGRSRRLLDISRFLFFPFISSLSPSARFLPPPAARCAPMCTCALYARTCLCLSERCVLDLSRFPADACKSCLPNLVSATRKCITRAWERAEKGGRGEGRGDDKLWIESWNCYETAQTSAKLWLPRYWHFRTDDLMSHENLVSYTPRGLSATSCDYSRLYAGK